MSLANFLLRAALGNERAPDSLDVALYLGKKEVADPGYTRFTIPKGSWSIRGELASCVATFGPLVGHIEYDRTVVLRGLNEVDVKVLPGSKRSNDRSDVVRVEIELDLKPE